MATVARTWLDGETGRLFDDGEELEILGGQNFIGFTIERDDVNNRYNITNAAGAPSSDDVSNESGVAGATVTLALDELAADIAAISGVSSSRNLIAGAGLTGGGDLSADRTFTVAANADGTIVVNANDIQVGVLVAGNFANNTIALARLANAGAAGFVGATGAGAWGALTGTQAAALLAGPITGITTLNGATVAAPVEGAQITTTATINVGQGNNRTVTAAGGAYAITLGTTGSPYTGEILSLVCSNSLANAVTVTNGGGGGGNIGPSGGTMPSGAKLVCDFVYDGTDWALAGVKRLA